MILIGVEKKNTGSRFAFLWLQLIFFYALIFVHTEAIGADPAITDQQAVTMAMVQMHHRPAHEIIDVVRSALSPGGRASVDKLTNGVIVFDRAEKLVEIKELIRGLDQAVPQVKVSLRSRVHGAAPSILSTRHGFSGNGIQRSTGTMAHDKQLVVRVSSGSSAFIRIATEVAFDHYWLQLCNRYGYRSGWFAEHKQMGTGLVVTPLVIGRKVDLTLMPALSFAQGKKIHFAEASTRITVPQNIWVPVFSGADKGNEVGRSVVRGGHDAHSTTLLVEVKVEVW